VRGKEKIDKTDGSPTRNSPSGDLKSGIALLQSSAMDEGERKKKDKKQHQWTAAAETSAQGKSETAALIRTNSKAAKCRGGGGGRQKPSTGVKNPGVENSKKNDQTF